VVRGQPGIRGSSLASEAQERAIWRTGVELVRGEAMEIVFGKATVAEQAGEDVRQNGNLRFDPDPIVEGRSSRLNGRSSSALSWFRLLYSALVLRPCFLFEALCIERDLLAEGT
jgi:hypothetical protein